MYFNSLQFILKNFEFTCYRCRSPGEAPEKSCLAVKTFFQSKIILDPKPLKIIITMYEYRS